jgi:hypothetical protein
MTDAQVRAIAGEPDHVKTERDVDEPRAHALRG